MTWQIKIEKRYVVCGIAIRFCLVWDLSKYQSVQNIDIHPKWRQDFVQTYQIELRRLTKAIQYTICSCIQKAWGFEKYRAWIRYGDLNNQVHDAKNKYYDIVRQCRNIRLFDACAIPVVLNVSLQVASQWDRIDNFTVDFVLCFSLPNLQPSPSNRLQSSGATIFKFTVYVIFFWCALGSVEKTFNYIKSKWGKLCIWFWNIESTCNSLV